MGPELLYDRSAKKYVQQNAHDSQQRPNQTCSVMLMFYIAPDGYKALKIVVDSREGRAPTWHYINFMCPLDWVTVPR